MPEHAWNELESIEDAGPFEASITLLRGESLKGQRRFGDAIPVLQQAAQMIPAPHNRRAWQSLGECYRLNGSVELAELVEQFADSPQISPVVVPPPVIAPILNISITIQPPIDMAPDDEET